METKHQKETILVELPSGHALHPVPAKYERVIEKDGERKKVLSYVNSIGQFVDIPIETYLDLKNESTPTNNKLAKLGIKKYTFTSRIINLRDGMDERDIRTSNLPLKFSSNGDTSQVGDMEFWRNHPDAEVDGVLPSGGRKLYIVTTVSKQKNQRIIDRKVRQEITNYVDAIEDDRLLTDILIYFGKERAGRNHDEMVNALVDGEIQLGLGGSSSSEIPAILFSRDNLETFRRVFMNEGDPNKDFVLTINKGRVYKKLTQKEGKEGGWYYKTSFLGLDDKEIQRYFGEHPNVFKSLKSEIEMAEGVEFKGEKSNMIPDAAKTDNTKNVLIETLNKLVDSNKVKLPVGTFIQTLSITDLQFYIDEANKLPKGFTTKGEIEDVRSYRGRINTQLGELVKSGDILLPEGTKRNELSTADMEGYLIEYFKKLNETPA